ncbi:MAG TPA: DUF6580 family putative transport protein [Pseudolabrys sp.]|nr:DUF6580 family putative transport protein [Pseudolabrys sp.]
MTTDTRASLAHDVLLIAFLVALGAIARIFPQDWNLMPVAATALFAGRVLGRPVLAPIVPLAAMLISDRFLAPGHLGVTLVVYTAFVLPAVVGMLSRRLTGTAVVAASMIGCSLAFFLSTNFAVWLWDGLYPLTAQGLADCYIAALPFLRNTVGGDLLWIGLLYAGLWLAQHMPSAARRSV